MLEKYQNQTDAQLLMAFKRIQRLKKSLLRINRQIHKIRCLILNEYLKIFQISAIKNH